MHGLEAGDGAQRGGLAAARRAQQAADVAAIQVQVEVLNDALLTIAAGGRAVVAAAVRVSCVVIGRLDKKLQQCLLHVQAVLGLIPGDRAGIIEQIVTDFLATVGRQAVHEQHVRGSWSSSARFT